MADRPMKRHGIRMHKTNREYWILFEKEGSNRYSEVAFSIAKYPDAVSAMAGFLRGEGHVEDRHYDTEKDWDDSFILGKVKPWPIDL